MKRFFHSASFKTLALVAAVVLIGVLAASFSHNASTPFSTVMSVVFSPLQKISSSIASEFNDLKASFTSSSKYIEENEKLKTAIEDYRSQLADYEELKKQNEAYERFYDIKTENPDFEFCYGTVVSRDAADAYGSFVLNAGSADGVEVDDPVIYGDYVVGVVKKVNVSSCVVYSVIDPRVKIGAYESGTREYGYVSGDSSLYKDNMCRLSGLSGSTSIVAGGIVCTSGAGGIFPAGLIIGEVKSVSTDDVSTAFYADIAPFSDIPTLTDVFIITDFEGKGEIS